MTQLTLQYFLAVGSILFVLGTIGFVCRRNLIIMFLSTELMFQGIAINLIAFGRYHLSSDPKAFFASQAFVMFVLVVAAAEAALALGLIVLLYRTRATLDSQAWQELKG